MYHLEMPLVFSRGRIHRHHRVAVKVGARPVAAVIVRSRGAEGHVNDSSLLVRRHEPSPGVDARAILPAVVEPRVVTRLPRPRHRLKLPQSGTRARIVGARIAWRPVFPFSRARAYQDDVFVNRRNSVVRHDHIYRAFFAEAGIDLPVIGIQRNKVTPGGEENARWILAVAGPVRHAPWRRRASLYVMPPDFLAGVRFERHYARLRGQV